MKKKRIWGIILLVVSMLIATSCNNHKIINDTDTVTTEGYVDTDTNSNNIAVEDEKDVNTEDTKSDERIESDSLILNPQFKSIRQAVYSKQKESDLQGTILVGVGDEIVYVESFGKASKWDNIANTNTTRYGIASLTKSFTAAAIMKLYEDGKLDINDTIDKYFPNYKYGSKITILELMQMRSGIVDYLNDMKHYMTVSDSKAIYDSFVEKEDFKGLDEYPWTRDDMLKNCFNNELIFEPDEQYSYSNTNYYLLGCIVEQVSGMSYERFITENILKPCGMTSSDMTPSDRDAVSYMTSEGFVSSSYETLFSAGGIRSNVFDMYMWLQNLSKGNVVSEKTFSIMIDSSEVAEKNRLHYEKEQAKLKEKLGAEYEEPQVDKSVIPTYYCCGLMVTGSEVWHQGYIDGFSNYMSVNLDTDVTIIILTNTSDDKMTRDIGGLWRAISEAANSSL